MGDRPPGGRRGVGPPIGRQVGDPDVEVVAFRTESATIGSAVDMPATLAGLARACRPVVNRQPGDVHRDAGKGQRGFVASAGITLAANVIATMNESSTGVLDGEHVPAQGVVDVDLHCGVRA